LRFGFTRKLPPLKSSEGWELDESEEGYLQVGLSDGAAAFGALAAGSGAALTVIVFVLGTCFGAYVAGGGAQAA
jgi:hypothetical protein